MAKLLYVVHRYAPYPGGSEYYTRDMAEESLRRGHDVTVLAHTHQGDYNSVKVTNDYNNALNQVWDLIIVHGGDVISQNIIHHNAYLINKKNRVAYMIIKPSESVVCLNGLKHHRYVTYSTTQDIEYIKKHNCLNKARRIRHGIVPSKIIRSPTVSLTDPPVFVSVGGFYPHKRMAELAHIWKESGFKHPLHLYGYGEGEQIQESEYVKVFFGESHDRILQAISNARAYIMNSSEEGFGLVLLESMMNKTPWIARKVGGVTDLADYGTTYINSSELPDIIKGLSIKKPQNDPKIKAAYEYAMSNHTIVQTVNDIEDIIME